MAKNTKTKKTKTNKPAKTRNQPKNFRHSQHDVDYVKMVLDPCHGPKVTPPLPGGTGHLIRLRQKVSSSTIVDGMTPTTGARRIVFNFNPFKGSVAYKATSAGNISLHVAAGATASTGLQISNTPTMTFLVGTNIRRFRPVACCVEFVNYAASNAIAGAITNLQAGYELVDCLNNTVNNPTCDGIDANLEYSRMPIKRTQIWRPKTTPMWTTYSTDVDTDVLVDANMEDTLMTILKLGGEVGATSLDFDFIVTCIYEYEPEASVGIAKSFMSSPSSSTIEGLLAKIPPEVWSYGKEVAKYATGKAIKAGAMALGVPPMPYQALLTG